MIGTNQVLSLIGVRARASDRVAHKICSKTLPTHQELVSSEDAEQSLAGRPISCDLRDGVSATADA